MGDGKNDSGKDAVCGSPWAASLVGVNAMKRTAMLMGSLLLAAAGCIEDPTPEEAYLIVQGEADKPVRVIVSTEFVASVNEDGVTRIVLFAADTLVTTLPYEHRVRIEENQRFFAETARFDEDLQNIHMEVRIDEDVEFAEGGILIENGPFRFVYTFNQRVTREIQVL
jgi:hypothetical protein